MTPVGGGDTPGELGLMLLPDRLRIPVGSNPQQRGATGLHGRHKHTFRINRPIHIEEVGETLDRDRCGLTSPKWH